MVDASLDIKQLKMFGRPVAKHQISSQPTVSHLFGRFSSDCQFGKITGFKTFLKKCPTFAIDGKRSNITLGGRKVNQTRGATQSQTHRTQCFVGHSPIGYF